MSFQLRSLEGEIHEVSKEGAFLSNTIRSLLADLGEVTEVPVRIKSSILKKVIEWMEYAKSLPPVEEKEAQEDRILPDLTEWDTKFCDSLSDPEKVDMILAANYLEVRSLLDTVCISVCNLVKGQTPDELRKAFVRTAKPIPESLLEGVPTKKNEEEVHDGEPVSNEEAAKRKR